MVVAHFLFIQNGMMQIQLVQNIEVQMDERDRPQNGLDINWYLVLTSARWFVFRSTDMFALLLRPTDDLIRNWQGLGFKNQNAQ